MNYPILDFDRESEEIIKAKDHFKKINGFPKVIVSCFSGKIISKWAQKKGIEIIAFLGSANGKYPIYKTIYKGVEVGFTTAPVGAPMCVGMAEELVALGAENLVYLGSCGALDKNIKENEIIIPYRAIRDEGISYHYQEPSIFNYMNEDTVKKIEEVLINNNYKYTRATTWTTDAFYRETRNVLAMRKEQGATVVDMEVASLIAFSNFRNVKYAQFMYTADNLDAVVWDKRNLSLQAETYSEEYMILGFEIGLNM